MKPGEMKIYRDGGNTLFLVVAVTTAGMCLIWWMDGNAPNPAWEHREWMNAFSIPVCDVNGDK